MSLHGAHLGVLETTGGSRLIK